MNKKGYSAGFSWVIGLILLFALGVGYVILNQVMTVHINPVADGIIDGSPYLNATEVAEIKGENAKYTAFWNSFPYIAVFLIVIFIVSAAVRKGGNQYE